MQYIKFLRRLRPMLYCLRVSTATLAQLNNSLSRDEFVCIVGPVFEYLPWIAEEEHQLRSVAKVC